MANCLNLELVHHLLQIEDSDTIEDSIPIEDSVTNKCIEEDAASQEEIVSSELNSMMTECSVSNTQATERDKWGECNYMFNLCKL